MTREKGRAPLAAPPYASERPSATALDEALDEPAPKTSNAKEDRHFVSALARGLEVLSAFRDSSNVLGNQEIAEHCGLPKSTVSRLTYTLTKLGYLDTQPDTGRYRLGMAAVALGASALSKFDVRRIAHPYMQELAEFSGASISLGVRDRLNIVYIDNARGNSPFTLNVDTGWRVPIATTSIGRAYLATCAPAERNFLLDSLREQDPAAWPVTRDSIEAAIAQYRELGCCCSFREWHPEVNAIGIAFRRGADQPPMALNCGGPAYSLTEEFLLEEVRPKLQDIVRRLEKDLAPLGV